MKTATGLTLVAIGAILAFAVNAHLRFINLNVVGWVVILTGLAGIFVPRTGYGWLRRRVVVRRSPRAGIVRTVDEIDPPYVLNPGAPTLQEAADGFETVEPVRPATETIEEYFDE